MNDLEALAREIAGLLSTLDFRPASKHPVDCLPMARLVIHRVRAEALADAAEPAP